MEHSRLRTLAEKRYLFDFFLNEIKCPCKYITVPFPPTFTVHSKQLVVSFQAASYAFIGQVWVIMLLYSFPTNTPSYSPSLAQHNGKNNECRPNK